MATNKVDDHVKGEAQPAIEQQEGREIDNASGRPQDAQTKDTTVKFNELPSANQEIDEDRRQATAGSNQKLIDSTNYEDENEDYDELIRQISEAGFSETKPIDTLDDLLAWETPDPRPADFIRAKAPRKRVNECQTLICHDMKGGYLDDRLTQGTSNHRAYRFYNWAAINYFCYFSHRFVTIPPIPWVQAAHKNGVAVLGTLITEWSEGHQICTQMLKTKETAEIAARQLVAIALAFGFEGWLLNFECSTDRDQVDTLVHFVRELTTQCHERIPGGFVVWYDSVCYPNGCLSWQNALNNSNKAFFDACDGIFLNYGWTKEGLKRSKDLAGDRYRDIYVGIDVFGRGCYGGGGWNTRAAVKVIQELNLSSAIFAPGWVHETQGEKDFVENDHKYWKSCKLPVCHVPTTLPLITSFCQGFGKQLVRKGERIESGTWHNLLRQQLQPSNITVGRARYDVAFTGGSCLELLNPDDPLFLCDIHLEPGKEYLVSVTWMGIPLIIDLAFHPHSTSSDSVHIQLDDEEGGVSHPLLKSRPIQAPNSIQDPEQSKGSPLKSLLRNLSLHESWETLSHVFEVKQPINLTEIYVRPWQPRSSRQEKLSNYTHRALLGGFKLIELKGETGRQRSKRSAATAFGPSQ